MKTIAEITKTLASPDLDLQSAKLEEIAKQVHPTISKFNSRPASAGCRTVCHWELRVFSKRHPQPRWVLVCELVCPGDK